MKKFLKTLFFIFLGNLMYTIGVNLFTVPIGLYSGGVYGLCQLLRTWLATYFEFGTIDVAGILYLIVNIPLFVLAYKSLGKKFFISTVISVVICNVLLTFLTFDFTIVNDTLTNCIIGGILAGAGAGIVLRAGSCGGGTEVIGMYLIKNNKKFSIGQINLFINLLVYSICAVVFSVDIAVYSIIFSVISSITLDKLHEQTIKVNALIFTDNYEIAKGIETKLVRGSTSWEGKGDYTGNKKYIISTVISKYEENTLRSIVKELDKNAFVIINRNVDVFGYIENRLEA